ncbi:tudor domain protein [Onchocerca flexuosa]|uniref:Tudor domain protein n=1 Tax=Onchocerca flexuosa TaxID=387005 RepID=A0A238BXK0_9BILA|nr:tudor domain protein [Onchocerca flexuosa]
MNKRDKEKWAIHNDRDDIVPISTVQGYIQTGFFYKCLLKDVSNDLDNFGLLHQPVRMALATRVQISNLPPLLVPAIAGEYIRARISYVADPERLFVQLENNAWIILKIGERLRNLAKQRHEPLCNPECGTIVAALYPLDGCYYRAAVFSKIDIDYVVVIYIDYGNMASININNAFLLKDAYLLSIPPQAIQLIIGNGKKPRLTSEQIKNLLTDQTVGAQINDVSRNGESFIANLFVKDERNKSIDLTEVILGERPAPTLPLPKPVTIDSFLDMEDKLIDYADQSSSRGSNGSKVFESYNFSGDSSRNHFDSEWKRTCKGNYETAGPRKQNRDGRGSLSNNFRSKIDHDFSDCSDGSAPRIGDRRTCRNSDERGHTVFYRGNNFHGGKRGNGSESQRFIDNGNFAGSFYSSGNGIRDNSGPGSCFGRSKGRGGRLHLPERKDRSLRSFLDRDTGNDDIAADKSGWKSDNWKTSPSIDTAKNELACVSSNGFEKKADTENWIVNEGGWGLNNTDCQLVDNKSQIETSERISEDAATTSACNDFDDVGNFRNVKAMRYIFN